MGQLNAKVARQLIHRLPQITKIVKDTIRYRASIRGKNRRFSQKKARGRFQTLGKVHEIERRPRGAVLQAEQGSVEIYFLSPDIVRVRMRRDNDFLPPFSYAVEKVDWPSTLVTYEEEMAVFTIRTEHLVCRVHRTPCRLIFETAEGQVISEDADGLAWREHEVQWNRRLPEQEWSYGLGQRASSLNLRGKRLALWNADPRPYSRGTDPVYCSIPFYLGVRADLAYGIFWDNPARGYVDVGAGKSNEMTFFAEDGELRFYLMAGSTAQTVLALYTELTGRMPLPPMWALGFHQSRSSYKSDAVFRSLANEFRQRRLPCDALYFDIEYMDDYQCFTWDRKNFALLPGLLSDLERQGFKSVTILNPGIGVKTGDPVYEEGVQEDVFLKYPDGTWVAGPVWPSQCYFPDFTCARVRAWWADRINTLVQAGFAGIWTDMNEPALMTTKPGETLPDYVRHDWDGLGQTHVQGGHNVYGMLMARATREGLIKYRPDKRPFVITRAGYAGMQRYASSWTGDNVSSWDHLRLSISMVLNMGLSGAPFTGPDIGGFWGEPDGELYTRWMQLGSMLPFFRVHSMQWSPPQEPWAFGERYEHIIRHYLELRYQLLPYIYSTFAQCAQEGLPIIRPVFMIEPDNPDARTIDDEFLLGDSILVAPVLEPKATQRQVYLPRGVWYEYDTGRLIDGAQEVTIAAPLERMPIYIRAGRVIPMWPVMQYVGERRLEESRLRVYAGSGESSVYEDAGEGMAYQRGEYRWSYFTCKFLSTGQFAIEWRRAGKYEPPYPQMRVEVVGIPSEPESVEMDGQAAPVWYYEGGMVEFIVKPFGEARIGGRGHAGDTLAHAPHR